MPGFNVMPSRNRRINKRNNKNKKRKFNIRNNNKFTFNRIRTPIVPDNLRITLKFTQLSELSGAAFGEYVYSGNSLFDPDSTGIGSQPAGFDEWSAFYARYRTLGSRIVVKFTNHGTSVGVFCSVFPSLQSAGASGVVEAIAQPYSKYRQFGPATGNGIGSIINHMGTGKIWGMSVKFDDLFSALTSASPTRQWYWCINSLSSDSTTNLDMDWLVEIYYDVVFSQRKNLTLSLMADNPDAFKRKLDMSKMTLIKSAEEKFDFIN